MEYKIPWQKTSQQEILDYIVKYQSKMEEVGLKGAVPSGPMIKEVFGISLQRAHQYLAQYRRRLNNLK